MQDLFDDNIFRRVWFLMEINKLTDWHCTIVLLNTHEIPKIQCSNKNEYLSVYFLFHISSLSLPPYYFSHDNSRHSRDDTLQIGCAFCTTRFHRITRFAVSFPWSYPRWFFIWFFTRRYLLSHGLGIWYNNIMFSKQKQSVDFSKINFNIWKLNYKLSINEAHGARWQQLLDS
jgi:hypothetical protein